MNSSPPLLVAGQPILRAQEHLKRYCGLTGEQWAYNFYDRVPVDRDGVTDLLTTAVMHGPVTRADLQWFADTRSAVLSVIDDLPPKTPLEVVSDTVRDRLADGVADISGDDPKRRGLLTKILHRHRPDLVVIDERAIAKTYARTHRHQGRLPYRRLLDAVAEDLALPSNRAALTKIRTHLATHGLTPPTPLRTLDIAIWMDNR